MDGRRKIFGIKHMDTIISMNNLASIQEEGDESIQGADEGFLVHLKMGGPLEKEIPIGNYHF